MTVGQDIRNRKTLHTGSLCGLNNTDKGNIMGCHCIELNSQLIHIVGGIVSRQNGIRDGTLLCFLLICCLSGQRLYLCGILLLDNLSAANQIYAAVI